jgi:hypothetical protein
MDAAEDFDSSSQGGSPMPAYKLQIQIHQLERQLVEQVTKTQEEANKWQKLVRGLRPVLVPAASCAPGMIVDSMQQLSCVSLLSNLLQAGHASWRLLV